MIIYISLISCCENSDTKELSISSESFIPYGRVGSITADVTKNIDSRTLDVVSVNRLVMVGLDALDDTYLDTDDL